MMMRINRKGVAFFPIFFGAIMMLFLGILIYVYRGSRAANPVILDERGQPRDTAARDVTHR